MFPTTWGEHSKPNEALAMARKNKKRKAGLSDYHAMRRAYTAEHGQAPPKGTKKADLEALGFGSKKKKKSKKKKRKKRTSSSGSSSQLDWTHLFW